MPIPNGANIGGNLMYYQNLELEFPLIEAVQTRRVFGRAAGRCRRTSCAPPTLRSPAISRSETASAAAAGT